MTAASAQICFIKFRQTRLWGTLKKFFLFRLNGLNFSCATSWRVSIVVMSKLGAELQSDISCFECILYDDGDDADDAAS